MNKKVTISPTISEAMGEMGRKSFACMETRGAAWNRQSPLSTAHYQLAGRYFKGQYMCLGEMMTKPLHS